MNMAREEAIERLEWYQCHAETGEDADAFDMAISALRPVSRERVEKMKKAPVEGECDELYAPTYKCPECGFENTGRGNFCRNCGCPYTDEAVEMVMERMEALKDAVD